MFYQIILACDDKGKFLEYIPKKIGHTGEGRRHLAVTVLLYNNKGEVLLQKRKHQVFDNIWDFTASTHPLHTENGDESLEEATLRALQDEYGVENVQVKEVGSFNYFAKVGSLCENEHDYLLIGEYNGEIKLNPKVAYECKWVDKGELFKDMEKNPKNYSPWSQEGLKILKESGFFYG
ncbi:NUDIX domain-containing protein [Candidatus Daviesbacteria bacterium]|nr:NUDIX domain-containing protein [Candidatus Daviesbacteria bacterium]